MNVNESFHLTLNDNEDETVRSNPVEDRYNRYDKLNFKYSVITFLFILFSLINLSFYFINSFSFVEENYTNNDTEDSFIQKIIAEESHYLYDNPTLHEKTEPAFIVANNGTNSLRHIEEDDFFDLRRKDLNSFSISEEQQKIVDFLMGFNQTYEGIWNAISRLNKFEESSGDLRFNLRILFPGAEHETMLIPGFVIYDGKYVENLYIMKLQNHIFRNSTNTFFNLDIENNHLNASFNSFIVYRSLYDKTQNFRCKLDLELNWKKDDLSEIDYINGSLLVEKNCTVNMNVNFNLRVGIEKKSQYLYYSIFSSIISLLGIFSTIWLSIKTTSSVQNSKAISLVTLGQNIIWDAYGCITNFFIMAGDDTYFLYFSIPSFLYFVQFSVFELRLLYYIWRNKNAEDLENNQRIRRKLLKFYLIFYISMFLGLFFVTKFYFVKEYLFFSLTITWLPQIIYNFSEKNFASLPLINIIIMSINKLAFPIYIRSVENNVFRVKPDNQFCQLVIAVVFIEVFVMYLQSIFGPRFLFPIKTSSNSHKYYYKKEEILQINKEYEFAECLICLTSLFPNDFEVKDNKNKDLLLHLNLQKENLFKRILKRTWNILFEFHNYRFCSDKKYIITPCLHVYHSECLEAWLLYKNECPSDRAPLSDIIGLNAQANKCTQVVSPKIYSECGVHDSLATSTVCCLVRGVYGGNNGTACIPVDSLFANKSISLTTNGATGTMVCGSNVSSALTLKISIMHLLVSLMFLVIL